MINVKTNEVEYPAPSTSGALIATVDNSTSPPTVTYSWGSLSTTAKPPVFSLPAGTYATSRTLTITSPDNATIRYTTDGSYPDASSATYSGPIQINNAMTVKAICTSDTLDPSTVTSAVYTITRRMLLAAQGNPAVAYSDDNGSTWTEATVPVYADTGGAGGSTSIAVAGDLAVMCTQYGTCVSRDRGLTWSYQTMVVGTGDPLYVVGGGIYQSCAVAVDGLVIVFASYAQNAAGQQCLMFRTTRDGINWQWFAVSGSTDASSDFSNIRNVAYDGYGYQRQGPVVANVGNTYVIVAYYGLYVSTDRGATWAFTAPSIYGGSYLNAATVHMTLTGLVITSGVKMFYSADGLVWVARTMPASTISKSVVRVGPTHWLAYATVSSKTKVYRSSDNGATWVLGSGAGSLSTNWGDYSFLYSTAWSNKMFVASGYSTYVLDALSGFIEDNEDFAINGLDSASYPLSKLVWTGSAFYGVRTQGTGGSGGTAPARVHSGMKITAFKDSNSSIARATMSLGASLAVLDDTTGVPTGTAVACPTPTIASSVASATILDHSTLFKDFSASNNGPGHRAVCWSASNSLFYYLGATDGFLYSLSLAGVVTKITSTNYSGGVICFNETDGFVYMAYYTGVYKMNVSTGATTLIYTLTGGVYAKDICHNTTDGFLYFSHNGVMRRMTTAGGSVTSSSAVNYQALSYDATDNVVLGTYNNTIYKISAALVGTVFVSNVKYIDNRAVRLGNDYYCYCYNDISQSYAPAVVFGGTTLTVMMNNAHTYPTFVRVGTQMYWSSPGEIRLVDFPAGTAYTVEVAMGATHPALLYTTDGTDPTPTQVVGYDASGLGKVPIRQNATYSTRTGSLIGTVPDRIKLVGLAAGTLKCIAYAPGMAPSAVVTQILA